MKATAKRIALGVFAVALVATVAYAAVLLDETFPYADGPLDGIGGWIPHSGAGNKPIQVESGQAKVQQSPGSGEDLNTLFPQRDSLATTYACFEVTVPRTGPLGNAVVDSDIYFADLHVRGTFFHVARTYTSAPQSGGDYTIALSVSSGGATVYWPTDLNFDQKYKIALKYDAGAAEARLWIDPTSEADPSIFEFRPADRGKEQLDSFAIRQNSGGGGLGSSQYDLIDNIKVGDTFSEVCDRPVQVESATWGKIKGDYR